MRRLLQAYQDAYVGIDLGAIAYDEGVHAKHRLTRYHDFFVERIRPGERVLDVGCGKGELAHDIAERSGATVVAIHA
jgi:2-polyprenyl-3-methyl-5-hydroxy-6-metoxy-1,4-benzoquinol methylase